MAPSARLTRKVTHKVKKATLKIESFESLSFSELDFPISIFLQGFFLGDGEASFPVWLVHWSTCFFVFNSDAVFPLAFYLVQKTGTLVFSAFALTPKSFNSTNTNKTRTKVSRDSNALVKTQFHHIFAVQRYFLFLWVGNPVLLPFNSFGDPLFLPLKITRIMGCIAVISTKNHKRQRRKRQSVTVKREKLQPPKILTAILTLPFLT